MKRIRNKTIILMALALLLIPYTNVNAEDKTKPEEILEPMPVEMTYYTDYGTCANGKQTRDGICAFAKDYIGMSAIVYENNNGKVGDFIGFYEIYDTGYGRPTKIIKQNGKPRGTIEAEMCIDIWFSSDTEGKEFIEEHGNQVFIQIIQIEG